MSRIFSVRVASVYPHYVTKAERKGRTEAEVREVFGWLTGFDDAELSRHLADGTTFEDFFAAADLNPRVDQITGSVCGVKVHEVEDPVDGADQLPGQVRRRAGQGTPDDQGAEVLTSTPRPAPGEPGTGSERQVVLRWSPGARDGIPVSVRRR